MFSGNGASAWRVLIVDDDEDNLSIATQVLSFYGAEVHTAEDGEEGLEMLSQLQPTLVLLDLSMPRMNGWMMLQHIRADPRTAHIPVIAVTAHAMRGDRERVLEAGFDAYIAKPFQITDFMEEISRIVDEFNL